ncbi:MULTISPECIES: arginine deiminase family protein [Clostridium]|uniref:Nitrate reductase n=1 Tax=Clostridium cibarium TaxID=2762247 RepID=A0ABR8PQP0_9CLOT|nr:MULTISPECIES: arginine deiminase family protein [Clostridium]MBD7910483.1 nitrate reductase [Clostridium cibarium]
MKKVFVKNSSGVLKKVLMCRPTFLKAVPINEIARKWQDVGLDVEIMEKEHRELVKAFEDNGVEVVMVEADSRRGNSVFSRDFGGCIREGYILGRFKEPVRFLERDVYEEKMKELNIPKVAECKNGLFEGGDFTFLDNDTLAIGIVERSNEEGIEEIRKSLSKYGYKVIEVPCDKKYLHLDLCFNLVDEKLAVAYRDGLPETFLKVLDEKGIATISITEECVFKHGCNLQSIGDKRVISLKSNGYVNEELRKRGFKVIELDITEILKAGGGPHCMTFPLSRL